MVIIKSEDKNRGNWPLGIIQELYTGQDGIVRAVRLRAGQNYLERPVQQLYPLELVCDVNEKLSVEPCDPRLKADVPEFQQKRKAAVEAREKIQEIV